MCFWSKALWDLKVCMCVCMDMSTDILTGMCASFVRGDLRAGMFEQVLARGREERTPELG